MSAEPSCGTSGEAYPKGTSAAPGGQRDEQRGVRGTKRTLTKPWRWRRDRWGKLNRLDVCHVCGRRLWVNWVRAAPCLWCDETVAEMRRKAK